MKLFWRLWKRILWLPLLLVFALPVQSQVCPAGTHPAWYGTTRDQVTDLIRELICVDIEGRLFSIFDTATVGVWNDVLVVDGEVHADIAAALTAATANSTVFVPPGTFTLSASLALNKANLKLVCAGIGVTTIVAADSLNANLFQITANGVEVSHCTLDGNKANQTSGAGFNVQSADDVVLDHVEIKDTWDKAVQASDVDNFRLTDYIIANANQAGNFKAIQINGVAGSSKGIYIRGGKLDQSAANAGCIAIASATNGNTISKIRVTDNECIVGDAGGVDTLGIEFFNASGGIIEDYRATDNDVYGENTTNTNIFGISDGGSAANNRNGRFIGNTVRDANKIAYEIVAASGITGVGNSATNSGRSKFGGGANDITWVANDHQGFVDTGNGNQHIELDNSTMKNIKIIGNNFQCFRFMAIQFIASTGTTEFSIQGNTFDGCNRVMSGMAGVRIEGADVGDISGNTFRDISDTNGRAISINATAGSQISYSGNRFANIALSNVGNFVTGGDTVAENRDLDMIEHAGVIFTALGAHPNGTFVYCSDCTIANPCAAAGTGAHAKRLNGVWVCN